MIIFQLLLFLTIFLFNLSSTVSDKAPGKAQFNQFICTINISQIQLIRYLIIDTQDVSFGI